MNTPAESHYLTDIVRTTHENKHLIRITGVDASADRFWRKVDRAPGQGPNGDCWEWTACRLPSGYGRFAIGPTTYNAHRVAYDLSYPDDPLGSRLVMHSCDNPPCCRGEHLSAGTYRDNMQDAAKKGRMARLVGEFNGRYRLAAPLRTEVRAAYASGKWTQAELATLYGIAQATVSRMVRHKGGGKSG